MKSGAFKSRQDFYTVNQLVTLDACFSHLFGPDHSTLFRSLLLGKLHDPHLFDRLSKLDSIHLLKAITHMITNEDTNDP